MHALKDTRTHYPILESFFPVGVLSFLGVKLPNLKWDSQVPTHFERIPNFHRKSVSFLRGLELIYAPLWGKDFLTQSVCHF